MKHHISAYLDNAITLLLLLVAGVTPLLFFNQTTEFYDTPKLIFLIVSTLLLTGLWIASWIFKGKIVITRTPLDIFLLVFAASILISTWFSTARFTSIFGNIPSVHGSAVAWIAYILLYFVTVSHLKTLARIKTLLTVLYASGVVVALITLFSFFGIFLPFDFAQTANFTPTGSSFSTVAFLLLLLPLPLVSLLSTNPYITRPFALALSILFSVTIVLIGNWPINIALAIVYLLAVFITKPYQVRRALPIFLAPVITTVVFLFLTYTSLPQPLGFLHEKHTNFPQAIQLSFPISWKVTASTFRDVPIQGTGPATYLFNFTAYKPLEFNQLPYWNFAFDNAYNEFLQVLSTLGIIGFSTLVFLSLFILRLSWRNLVTNAPESEFDNTPNLLPAIAISGIIAIVLLAIHTTTLVSVVGTFFILAILMMAQRRIRERVMEFSLGIRATTAGNQQFDLFPVIIFLIFLVGAGYSLFTLFTFVAGDYYHRQALAQAGTNGTKTYEYLQKAEQINPRVDLYRVDMAQTNFALANALAVQKGPTEENPEGSLTDQDRQTIQTLLSQSVNEARAAVTLNPRSSRNWEVLASVYRNISGVAQNALAFSLDTYGQAIQRDPLNPALRLNVGGIYYTAQNYDLAIRFFTDAINLKPDYVNAYFNLAIALRDKGDLANAQQVTEQALVLLKDRTESADYQLLTALLEDIKKRAGNEPSTSPVATAPAAENNDAIDETVGDVEVSNLNNPPSVTPVPSVRPNPNANVPQTNEE
ncbi:MAG TPA: tetratricopeptide repeat protein [Patescibacteria group bacterium]|nr:tetratricopeptide repeat protein [Patescibacteria group bacterium]